MAPGKHLKKGKLRTWWGEVGMMDRILLLLGVFLLAFTVCMAVFALCGAEGGIMGWIKNGKERIQSRKWEMEDRKNFSEGENHNDE